MIEVMRVSKRENSNRKRGQASSNDHGMHHVNVLFLTPTLGIFFITSELPHTAWLWRHYLYRYGYPLMGMFIGTIIASFHCLAINANFCSWSLD
jgi:hypothetical protein